MDRADVDRATRLPGKALRVSTIPPGAVPAPDDLPPEERDDQQQPDPFGDRTDEEGRPIEHREDEEPTGDQ
jgi:hypothetical protein